MICKYCALRAPYFEGKKAVEGVAKFNIFNSQGLNLSLLIM